MSELNPLPAPILELTLLYCAVERILLHITSSTTDTLVTLCARADSYVLHDLQSEYSGFVVAVYGGEGRHRDVLRDRR